MQSWLVKIALYRRLLIVVWLVQSIVLLTGLVLSIGYFRDDELQLDSLSKYVTEQKDLHQSLLALNATTDAAGVYRTNRAIELMNLQWQSRSAPFSKEELIEWKQPLLALSQERLQEMILRQQSLWQQQIRKRTQLIWIAVLSFLFGFVLPSAVFWLLGRLGWKLKQESERQVKSWLKGWSSEKQQYNDPFRHPEFWLRIGLLSAEHFGPHFRHPLALYFSELAREIRQELAQHSSDPKADAASGSVSSSSPSSQA